MPIPAPSPEIYDRAADLAQACGWTAGDLGEVCDIADPKPCCINGHLMNAVDHEPNYDLYDDPDYQAIAREVVETLLERGESLDHRLSSPGMIQGWNDHDLSSAARRAAGWSREPLLAADYLALVTEALKIEVDVLRRTAERLRRGDGHDPRLVTPEGHDLNPS
jgi:hypothetical protein